MRIGERMRQMRGDRRGLKELGRGKRLREKMKVMKER